MHRRKNEQGIGVTGLLVGLVVIALIVLVVAIVHKKGVDTNRKKKAQTTAQTQTPNGKLTTTVLAIPEWGITLNTGVADASKLTYTLSGPVDDNAGHAEAVANLFLTSAFTTDPKCQNLRVHISRRTYNVATSLPPDATRSGKRIGSFWYDVDGGSGVCGILAIDAQRALYSPRNAAIWTFAPLP